MLVEDNDKLCACEVALQPIVYVLCDLLCKRLDCANNSTVYLVLLRLWLVQHASFSKASYCTSSSQQAFVMVVAVNHPNCLYLPCCITFCFDQAT